MPTVLEYGALRSFQLAGREDRGHLFQHYLRRFFWYLTLPLQFLLAVFLRRLLLVLKPFVHIRFGRYWSFSMGCWAVQIEEYLCKRALGEIPKGCLDIFYCYDRNRFELKPHVRHAVLICNTQLHKMFRPKLHLWQGAMFLDYLNRLLPKGSEDFSIVLSQPHDEHGVLGRIGPQLSFLPSEERRGTAILEEWGVSEGTPFVCFHARDRVYVEQTRPRLAHLYGDWVSQAARDTSIQNYLLATEMLTRQGYTAIRMGKFVEEPIQTDNPRIIDYAWKYHSDFMDVYLSAHCRFFIGQNSGMTGLPIIFRRPMAFVNIFPFSESTYCSYKNAVFIPKKYYSEKHGRLLTFREILSHRLLASYAAKHVNEPMVREWGLVIMENSPEEISELVQEVEERIQGVFQATPEDHRLQQRFLTIFRDHWAMLTPVSDMDRVQMGTHFLRRHPELLE